MHEFEETFLTNANRSTSYKSLSLGLIHFFFTSPQKNEKCRESLLNNMEIRDHLNKFTILRMDVYKSEYIKCKPRINMTILSTTYIFFFSCHVETGSDFAPWVSWRCSGRVLPPCTAADQTYSRTDAVSDTCSGTSTTTREEADRGRGGVPRAPLIPRPVSSLSPAVRRNEQTEQDSCPDVVHRPTERRTRTRTNMAKALKM